MAIIYTYPTVTPLETDKVLISDANNKTKNATLSSVRDAIDVVDTFTNSFGTYISGTINNDATGDVKLFNVDLNAQAVGGGRPDQGIPKFLRGDNFWATIDAKDIEGGFLKIIHGGTGTSSTAYCNLVSNTNGVLPINKGGTGSGNSNEGLNNLLPDQSGNSGKILSTDGTDTSWVDDASASPGGSANNIQFKSSTNTFDGSISLVYVENNNVGTVQVGNLGSTTGKVQIYGGSSDSGELSLIAPSDEGVTINVPTAPNDSYTVTLPGDAPSNNQVLKSNASGELSWVDWHEQGTFSPTISTSSGTYTGGFTNNTTYTIVEDIVTVFWHIEFNATGGAGTITFTLPVNAESSSIATGSFFPMRNTLKPSGENNIVGMKVGGGVATMLHFDDADFLLDSTGGSPVISTGQLIVGTLTYRKA